MNERTDQITMIDKPRHAGAAQLKTPSAKAQLTRQKLLVAAERVFADVGFFDTRVADIAIAARVAHGTFYTYFESKTDIFRAVLAEVLPPIYQPSNYGDDFYPTPFERIEHGNRRFLEVYRRNSRMIALLEQAATFDSEVRALRIKLRHTAEDRVRHSILRMQERKVVDSSLDPEITASCLVAMATHAFYTWLVVEERDYDLDSALITLSRLWGYALGLKPEASDRPQYQ